MSSDPIADPFETDAVNHILFGTDGDEVARRAQRWAMGIARFWEARVTVVCAYDSPKSFRKRGSIYLPEVRREMEQDAEEIVRESVEEFVAAGITAEGVVYEGDVEDAILETAEQITPDVIVIGGGGGGGARDYLVGSNVERIVRHSTVAVLVIK